MTTQPDTSDSAHVEVAWDDETVRLAYAKETHRLWWLFAIGVVTTVLIFGIVILAIVIPLQLHSLERKRKLQRYPIIPREAKLTFARGYGAQAFVLLRGNEDWPLSGGSLNTFIWRLKAFNSENYETVGVAGDPAHRPVIITHHDARLFTLIQPKIRLIKNQLRRSLESERASIPAIDVVIDGTRYPGTPGAVADPKIVTSRQREDFARSLRYLKIGLFNGAIFSLILVAVAAHNHQVPYWILIPIATFFAVVDPLLYRSVKQRNELRARQLRQATSTSTSTEEDST